MEPTDSSVAANSLIIVGTLGFLLWVASLILNG